MRFTEHEKQNIIDSIDSEIDLFMESRTPYGRSHAEKLRKLRKRIEKAETKKWWEFWK
jgi:hypothetical protein